MEFDSDEIVCSECGGVPEDEVTRLPEGWAIAEFGLLCPPCARQENELRSREEAEDVRSTIGKLNLEERVLLDAMFPDVPAEIKEEMLAKLESGGEESL